MRVPEKPDIERATMCFACGVDNPIGLRIRFRMKGGRCLGEFTPGANQVGYANTVHGGIIYAALDDVMANVRARGAQLADGLQRVVAGGAATAVRGRGLMLGLETAAPIAREVVAAARDRHGLLVNATGETTLRLVPPLTISADEVDVALERLAAALADAGAPA